MNRLTANLSVIADHIREIFSAQDAAREKALPLGREVIRNASDAIRAVHRQEFDSAAKLLQSAQDILDNIQQVISSRAELSALGLGFIRDAQKEYAEASITLALVTGKELPTPQQLRVDVAAYMNGLGEAVGELRRYMLDGMRRGDLSRAEDILSAMDDIYSVLVTMDFPDVITCGLRRTTDMVRGVLERTRSDLTLTIRQLQLEKKLDLVDPR